MAVVGIDLGGTKINSALYDITKNVITPRKVLLNGAEGDEVGVLIKDLINSILKEAHESERTVTSVGISVPGIYNVDSGKVWAPNIPGWDNYPLLNELQERFNEINFHISSDRSCYIMGEIWKGKARNCKNAIFLSVGTGLAAGIIVNGQVLNGAGGIAGSIGWMALNRPYMDKYSPMGCAEYYASGEGIARYAQEVLATRPEYSGVFRSGKEINAFNIIAAYEDGDEIAKTVIKNTIHYWGMLVANLVSVFNPEKIIFGGGVFSGDACMFIDRIYEEALKWGQPISMKQVKLECSENGDMAGLYGAIYLALNESKEN